MAARKKARKTRTTRPRKAAKKTAAGRRAGPFRLDPAVRPRGYHLHLALDPARDREYVGEVRIELTLDAPRRTIRCHAVDLEVTAHFESAEGQGPAKVTRQAADEALEVAAPAELPAGPVTLVARFTGQLRDDLRGLYQASAGPHRYAFTQLEATDARRFFPCFDEPCFKAPLTLTVTTAAAHQVVANSPARSVEKKGRQQTWSFEPTPALPTYLYALAVGALEASEPTHLGLTAIRLWHVPGKGHLTAFALEAACETLARLEGYFDRPYPYAKLDLVAVPDFEIGAMENAGAVFFRETLLLLDPARATRKEQMRAAEVIAHELAHMWYGDLVTPYWWDDLWLKEAFATWMAFAVVDDWRPQWEMWLEFQNERAVALHLDALQNTHPIYADVRTPEEASENFDAITYKKGAAVVRMLEQSLTPLKFRDGVRRYVKRHAGGNARGDDLWQALSEASGQDVRKIVRGWIEQEGFPLLLVRRGKGGKVTVRQERLVEKAGSGAGATTRWPVPWVGRCLDEQGGSTLDRRLLTRRQESFTLGDGLDALYGNAGEAGFYRVLHDDAELEALRRRLPDLAAVERMGLIGHLWACVRADRCSVDALLPFVAACASDPAAPVIDTLFGCCLALADDVAPHAGAETAAAFRRWLVNCFAGPMIELGWEGADDEPRRRLRRAAVYSLLGRVARWQPVLEHASGALGRYLDDPTWLEPDLADPVVFLGASTADEARHAQLVEALRAAHEPLARRRAMLALTWVRDAGLMDRSLALCLTDAVPTQDVVSFLVQALANPDMGARTWQFIQRRWKTLSKRLTPSLVPRLILALPALQTRAARDSVAGFFREHPVATAQRTLRQVQETFDVQAAVRRREAPRLRRWLAKATLD